MGKQDNWHTPKQLKIERDGEPKRIHRGLRKKRDRRKGKKARIDEILAAKKEAERYRQCIHDEARRRIEHPEWYTPVATGYYRFENKYKERFAEYVTKMKDLTGCAVEDGVISAKEAEEYVVELYPF